MKARKHHRQLSFLLNVTIIGNAEQWRWFVPHDIPGLIDLFGSNESFVNQLDIFFEKAKGKSNILPNEYYW